MSLTCATSQNQRLATGCQVCLTIVSTRLLVKGNTLVQQAPGCLCMQAKVVDSRYLSCESPDQLSKKLNTAEDKAASLARLHAEADEQLRQQTTLLDQV